MATALKVTDVPWQTAPVGFAEILTLTGLVGLTVIVMEFDAAGFPETHVSLEVNMQVTTSPLAGIYV